MTISRADVIALLEDGPKPVDQLATWLQVGPSFLATHLTALRIPACQRCGAYFIPWPNSSGKYCSRRCYAPNPGPSHQKRVTLIDPLDDDELSDVEDVADEEHPPLRQPPPSDTVKVKVNGESSSWWVGTDRETFRQRAAQEFERMRDSKEGAKVPVRVLL